MKNSKFRLLVLVTFLLGCIQVCQAADTGNNQTDSNIPQAAPLGITLVEIKRSSINGDPPEYFGVRFGDAEGKPIFVNGSDESGCNEQCSEFFSPFVSIDGAEPLGDWTLQSADDGAKQWVYQGKPAYIMSEGARSEELVQNIIQLEHPKPLLFSAISGVSSLRAPEGWHMVRYEPGKSVMTPAIVDVSDVASASALILVDAKGMTLYSYDGDIKAAESAECSTKPCMTDWQPLLAGELSNPIGEFTPVRRSSGSKQWTYKNKPLYTNAKDSISGDVMGQEANDPAWSIAVLASNFKPDDVLIKPSKVRGYILMTAEGYPLYTVHPLEHIWGGRSTYRFDVSYATSKSFAGKGCDEKCQESYKPFLASSDAQASGFWEIFQREDGRSQWLYKGNALYTYAGDKPFGVVTGSNKYEFVTGDNGRYSVKDVALSTNLWTAGMFLRVVQP